MRVASCGRVLRRHVMHVAWTLVAIQPLSTAYLEEVCSRGGMSRAHACWCMDRRTSKRSAQSGEANIVLCLGLMSLLSATLCATHRVSLLSATVCASQSLQVV